MLNISYKSIQARIAAIKAEADVSTGKPSGKDRAGANIRGNLFRGATGQFQAGPAGQLRQRIEAIREMRKAKGKKPKGKGKGAAPKPTPEEQAAAAAAEIAKNRADTFSALRLPEDAVGALDDLLAGTPTDDDGGLVKLGLAEIGTDGTLRLTAQGRVVSTAASQGDLGKAKDAASRGRDAVAKGAERAKAKEDKEKDKKEKSASGGGNDKKKPTKEDTEAPAEDKEATAQEKRATNRAAVADKMMANDAGVTRKGLDAMAGLSSGDATPDEETVDQLSDMGLVERAKDGTPRLTTQGRAAVRAAEKGDYGETVAAISRAADAVATRKEKEAELEKLEEEAPSDEELTSEAAATVGLEDQDVDDLRTAADEGGAANETLQAAGLVDKDGAATAEGVDALEALERGDVRGYRRAARKARARVRREKGKADKDKGDKQRAVEEEVSRIDKARGRGAPDRGRGIIPPRATKAQEQAHTGVMVALFIDSPALSSLPGVTEDADMLHVTLAYLGDTDDIQLAHRKDRLADALSTWATAQPPLTGILNGLGRFFNTEEDGTNAVYAAPDVPGLSECRAALLRCLRRAGLYAADNHGFTPHVTVAYVPADAPTPDIRFSPLPIAFDTITLAWGDERIVFPLGGASTKSFSFIKHGKHDQRSHGRSTARRAGARAAYSAARSAGASVADARRAASDVSAVFAAKQRLANIEKQLQGQVSEGQRTSLEAERTRLQSDIERRAARTPGAGNAAQQLDWNAPIATVRGRRSKEDREWDATMRTRAQDALDMRAKVERDARATADQNRLRELATRRHELDNIIQSYREQGYLTDKQHRDAQEQRKRESDVALGKGKPKAKGDVLDNLPQDLRQTTRTQQRALVDHYAQMPLAELRRRQDLNRQQQRAAYQEYQRSGPSERNERGSSNLQFMDEVLRAAIDKQVFGSDKPKARNPRR